jgi:hypothetical protein
MIPHTAQKPTFQEIRNNFFNLFIFVFIGFLFACGQRKIENKIVGNQLNILKTPAITLSRDSCLRVWQNLPITQDTVLAGLGIAFHLVKDYSFVLVCRDNSIHTSDNIENDSTRADLYIWYKDQERIIKIDSLDFGNAFYPFPDKSPINQIGWQDINFDGEKELLLKYNSYSISRGIDPFRFFRYNKDTRQLTFFKELISNSDIDIDNKHKTITLYEDSGLYCQAIETYRWQADTLQIIKRRETKWTQNETTKVEGDSVIFYELKNNKLVVVKQQFFKDRRSYDAVFYER